MDIFRNIAAVAGLMAVSALTALILAGSACTRETTTVSADTPSGLEEARDVVLATVGDTNITLGDYINAPSYYVVLHETFIKPELVKMKATELGITVTQEEVQEKYDEYVEESGGFEQFIQGLPPSAPASLLPDDLKRNISQQLYIQKILEREFDREHGPPTDQEIQDEFDMNVRMYQNMIANDPEYDVQPEEVTAEMATEQIKESIKNRWISNHAREYIDELVEEYSIENYALDLIGEEEDVIVPAIGEDTFDEMEPVEEEPEAEEPVADDEAVGEATGESGE